MNNKARCEQDEGEKRIYARCYGFTDFDPGPEGKSSSDISGDKNENCLGLNDYWIVKLDSSGNIQYQNTIGGNDDDWFGSIEQNSDGGFICGGYSLSDSSGDKTSNSYEYFDMWILKLDVSGNIEWQQTIGGVNYDYLTSISQLVYIPDQAAPHSGRSCPNILQQADPRIKGNLSCIIPLN